ncbi:zinc finger and BTB domain-containing protein 5 [Grus japonensis]|uniref:Zinc finger and BTB domain-containing protein 5 n=1 Tax=Grus japonensis TaxID=30415 RepID=A0ABC9YBT0_GRUJA
MVMQVVSLQPMEDHGGADIDPAAHGRPHTRALKEAVAMWRTRAGVGSWQELRPYGERSPCRSRFAGRTCDPVGDPCWSSLLLKDLIPWKGPMLEQFVKNYSLWEGPTLEKYVHKGLSPMGGTPCWSRGRV